MTIRRRLLLMLGAALLSAGACARSEAPPPAGPVQDVGGGWSSLYRDLAQGDCLYIGTVAEVLPHPGQRYTEWGTQYVEEQGELKFKVERTLYGESVPELRTHYVYSRADDVPASDWGGHVWDDHPPKRGQPLVVLAYGKKSQERFAETVKREGIVAYIWPALKESSFIEELAEGCGFLTATEVKDRIRLVKSLGRSKNPTIRWLVQDGVFGVDERGVPQPPDAPPELVLEYLRASAAPMPDYFPRESITESLVHWFSDKGHARSATEELREAFEDWYLGELDALGQDRNRDYISLGGLCELCRKLGVTQATDLFKRTGREGLIQRVTDYLNSPKPESQEQAAKLLALLNEK